MSIKIDGYTFEGRFNNTDSLKDAAGVYAILCTKENNRYTLIDVGESGTVKTRIENHDRKECWKKKCDKSLVVAVYYTPNKQQQGRMEIEQEIRRNHTGICGDR